MHFQIIKICVTLSPIQVNPFAFYSHATLQRSSAPFRQDNTNRLMRWLIHLFRSDMKLIIVTDNRVLQMQGGGYAGVLTVLQVP